MIITDLEHGMVVESRHMENSFSEIIRELNIPKSTVSRMYQGYLISIDSIVADHLNLMTDH